MSAETPKQAWLSRIVHDLRGPLMPLRTAAWLLRNELGESERARELVEIVDRQSTRLARMMDEFGEWARAGGGEQLLLEPRPHDAALAMDLVIGGIPGCQLEPRYDGTSAGARLLVDQPRFDQLLRTMIEHAMHRAADPPPDVDVWQEGSQLHIRVRDHGSPVEVVEREALLSKPQAMPFDGGLGLRLLLARRIAEAHGGSLVIDAREDQGLALVCSLPVHSQ